MPINKDKATKALTDAGNRLIFDLAAAMAAADAIATGKTVDSLAFAIEFTPTSIGFQLTGGPGWAFVEQGRGPTQNENGPGDLYPAIVEWCRARGIAVSAAWAITHKIHQQGTNLFIEGSRRNIYTGLVTKQGVQNIANSIGILGAASFQSDIVNALR